MDFVIKKLWLTIIIPVFISLVVIIAFELNIFSPGIYQNEAVALFVFTSIMELVTLISIPLALRLFKIKKIREELMAMKDEALGKWGVLRLTMLADTMMINTVLYYIFMNVAFGYLAIILFISIMFILPTKSRCYSDINP